MKTLKTQTNQMKIKEKYTKVVEKALNEKSMNIKNAAHFMKITHKSNTYFNQWFFHYYTRQLSLFSFELINVFNNLNNKNSETGATSRWFNYSLELNRLYHLSDDWWTLSLSDYMHKFIFEIIQHIPSWVAQLSCFTQFVRW